MWEQDDTYYFKDTALLKNDFEGRIDPKADWLICEDRLLAYQGKEKDVTIPDGINYVERFAFSNSRVKRLTFPKNCGDVSGTMNCRTLEEVIVECDVDIIGSIFQGCDRLESVIIRGNVPELQCFYSLDSLEHIEFNSSTVTYDIMNCPALTEIEVPDGKLEAPYFWGCSSLERVKFLGSKVLLSNDFMSMNAGGECALILPEEVLMMGRGLKEMNFWEVAYPVVCDRICRMAIRAWDEQPETQKAFMTDYLTNRCTDSALKEAFEAVR